MSNGDETLTDHDAAARDAKEPLRAPSARYEILEEIGRGGMGRVFRAFDRELGREVAVKELLHPSRDLRDRFLREAQVAARLQHPSIVPVYEVGESANGVPFYAMRLVSDETLRERIHGASSLEERLALLPHLLAVADAMAYAHENGVVHRDLKPSNVVAGPFGDTLIVDWGLAKIVRGSEETAATESESAAVVESSLPHPIPDLTDVELAGLTRTGAVLGTPAYMPPEQARGEAVDTRADVYALGAMLYELLVGQAPFGSRGATLEAVLGAAPPSVGEVERRAPKDLIAIVEKAMARDAAARYPDASGFSAELHRFQAGKLVNAREYSLAEVAWRAVLRHRTIAASLALLLVASGVGLGAWVARERAVAEQERSLRSTAVAAQARAED